MMQKKQVIVGQGKTSLILSELNGDTLFSNICLRASNSFGLISTFVSCENIKTHEPSMVQLLREEIERVKATKGKDIDSDFFQPGVVQRVDKNIYIRKLEDLLNDALEKDGSLNSSSTEKGSTSVFHHKQNDTNSTICSSLQKRSEQYKFRIRSLQKEIEDSQNSTLQLKKNRISLIRSMQVAQERIYVLQAELYEIINRTDDYTSSTVLNGSLQRMKTNELRNEIEKETSDKMALISSCKRQILLDDKDCARLDVLTKDKEVQLRERLASYHSFRKSLQSVSMMRSRILGSTNAILMKNVMMIWYQFKACSKQKRLATEKLMNNIIRFFLSEAIARWRLSITLGCEPLKTSNMSNFYGKGSVMLSKVLEKRQNACDEVIATIIAMCPKEQNYIPRNTSIDLSKFPSKIALGISRGDYFHNLGRLDDAIEAYLAVLEKISNSTNLETMSKVYWCCVVYERVAFAYMKADCWNKAILQLEILLYQAESSGYHEFIPCAEILLGKCYLENREWKLAKQNLLSGLMKIDDSNRSVSLLKIAYSGLVYFYEFANDQAKSLYYKGLLDSLTYDIGDKIKSKLMEACNLEAKMMGTSLSVGKTTHLQIGSHIFVHASNKTEKLEASVLEKMKEREECKVGIENLHKLMGRIDKEIETCSSNSDTKQTSSLIHDNDQKIDTIELIERLEARKQFTKRELQAGLQKETELSLQIKNMKDEKVGLQEDLDLEQGQLMQSLLQKRSIRCMTFNGLNNSGVNVYGRQCVGSQSTILTYEKDIYVYSINNGKIRHVFVGDAQVDNTKRDMVGHTGTITCIFFYGDKIYSGSLDTTVRCWSVSKESLEYVAKGHTATVTSICVDRKLMITGSVDKCLILWDACKGCLLDRVMGHSRGITCVHHRTSWCISGDMDGIILLWDIDIERNKLVRKRRLQDTMKCKMNVIKSSSVEIICGDADGIISIWWLETGEVLQRCKVHEKGINDLQFDATVLVTCGIDCAIKVLDVTTCQILQSIQGHSSPVLSVCFDRMVVLSLSTDGTMKQWLRCPKYGENLNNDVYHTFTDGDSLDSICRHYEVTMKDLLNWNVNRDLKRLTVGQKLIVIKGTSNEIAVNKVKGKDVDSFYPQHRERNKSTNIGFSTYHDDSTSLISRLSRE